MYSYVEKYAEFKIQSLKKSAGTQSCYAQRNTHGVKLQNKSKNGDTLVFYTLKCNS